MAEAIQAGVQDVFAAIVAHAAPRHRQYRNNNPLFYERDDDIKDEENPFGDDLQQLHQRRPNRNNDDARWTSGLKIDILEFNGRSQPEELLDWFVTVNEFIEFKDVPEQKRCLLSQLVFVDMPLHGGINSNFHELVVGRRK